jgi:hypothetical protein
MIYLYVALIWIVLAYGLARLFGGIAKVGRGDE